MKTYLSTNYIYERAKLLFDQIIKDTNIDKIKMYGVPRGGVPVAYLLNRFARIEIVGMPHEANVFVDDLIDSGKTRDRYLKANPNARFYALFNKKYDHKGEWLVFPWEGNENNDTSADDIALRLLQYIGEDPERGGLKDTPKRFLKAWKDYTAGYGQDPDQITCFEDGAENYDEMIVLNDIPVYSHCEHHLAPFFGTISVGYIPDGKIIGLSKISRIIDIYARRLQVQERLTTQVATWLHKNLKPLGVGVIVKCRHMCMESRGINRSGITTKTSSLFGKMKSDSTVRDEFLKLVE